MWKKVIAAGAALVATAGVALAVGLWPGIPLLGGAAYCVNSVNGVCQANAPAGNPLFLGSEAVPVDTYGANQATNSQGVNQATQLVALTQLGQGPMVDQTTVGTTQTIPNNTPFFFLDGAQASALTVTMPASAVEGQIQRIVCTAATVGTLTVAANTGQTLKNNPNAACTAGVGYAWRYQASNTTWYRFQ